MLSKIFAALMSFLMTILSFLGIVVPNNTAYEDISYGSGSSQVMDIYVPNDASNNKENYAVVLIHGGMYDSGSRKDMSNRCREITAKGYIAATMDYSLIGNDTYGKVTASSMVSEVGKAIQKLKEFSYNEELNIKKIALFGVGAGGHLALTYTYSSAIYSPIDIAFTAVQAAPSDFNYNIWRGDVYTAEKFANLVKNLSSTNISATAVENGSADTTCKIISPVNYINGAKKIPLILAYGGKDTTVPIGNAESLIGTLEKYGIPYEYYFYTNSSNSMSNDPLVEADFTNTFYRYCTSKFAK